MSSSTTDSDAAKDLEISTYNMEEKAAQFVSAVVLTIVTILAFAQIIKFIRSKVYPRAQYSLCIVFFLPVLIGWISLEHVDTTKKDHLLEKVLNLYKAGALWAFMYYMNMLLGWTVQDGKSFYSEDSMVNILMKQKKADCYLKCYPSSPLTTPAECKRFVAVTNFGVLQMALMLVLLEVIGVGLLMWDYDYFIHEKKGFWYTAVVLSSFSIKFCRSVIALNYILNYALFCARIPEFRDLAITSKFILLKLAMFLTEIQGLIIYCFAWLYVKYYDEKEDATNVTLYTNSLLLCSEMIICGILQFTIFPLSDFYFHPVLKEKLVHHDAKHAHDHDHVNQGHTKEV